MGKINWKRVAASALGVYGVAFAANAAGLPAAVGAHDWPTAKAAIVAGLFAGAAALVEAGFHLITKKP